MVGIIAGEMGGASEHSSLLVRQSCAEWPGLGNNFLATEKNCTTS